MSEDDIRTKVVYPWLTACGFAPAAISVEFSFEIRLGKSTYRVGNSNPSESGAGAGGRELVARPRADVLVRRGDTNLFVIEVKAPDEPVDDDARDQGISYARLLPRIAPFVLVTNGTVSRLYDAITKDEITGTQLTADHPWFKSGYHLSTDEIQLRAEAIETFISLSSENLLAFCDRQLAYRMKRLSDNDPASGKKYIPALYVDRRAARERLDSLLDAKRARVVAVTGRPQVGKTNFLCRFAEERVKKGHPVLFYPAVSLDGGLLGEIAEDFGWMLAEQSPVAVLVAKLGRVLTKTGKTLAIVIDGWNEAEVGLAHTIDREFERVHAAQPAIKLVVSFTNSAAKRLLVHAGGPTFVADETGIGSRGCDLLESDSSEANRQKNWSTVAVEAYDEDEQRKAYQVLAQHFGVTVPKSHVMVKDPYLLGVAMRHFAGQQLPDEMDEPGLIRAWLEARIDRYTLDGFDVRAAITELGREMIAKGCPLPERQAKRCWGLTPVEPIPVKLPEMAVLAFLGGAAGRHVDFYNSRDRDFVIACWSCGWPEKLATNGSLWTEFSSSLASRAGVDAITWFFSHLPYLSKLLEPDGTLPQIKDDEVRRLFLAAVARICLLAQGSLSDGKRREPSDEVRHFWRACDKWVEQCAAWISEDTSPRCRIEG